MSKILVIDDESAILENLRFVLELEDHDIITASSGEDGISIFKENIDTLDAVVTDMRMPKVSGMDVLREIKSIMKEMSVIVLTGHGDMENAILAMKEGAFEYLLKPINADMLTMSLKNAVKNKDLLVENVRMENEIFAKNKYLQAIHDSAQKILLNMLPQKLPSIEGFVFEKKYKSCDTVGGDMYDVLDMDKYICFYVFDVSSHGILASVNTIILKSFIQNIKYNLSHGIKDLNFEKVLSELNMVMNLNTGQDVFATMFIGFIEKSTNKLHYMSAGHIKQYIFNTNEILSLDSTGTVLGVFEEATFESIELQLVKGDKLLLFTDGVIEASKGDELFGNEKLVELLKNCRNNNIQCVIENVMKNINEYTNGEQFDDTTILGIELI